MTGEAPENRQVPTIFLATCPDWPGGEPGGEHLVAALAARGIDVAWPSWDDPGVDWAAADLVAARSTWDYHERTAEFLAWARSVPRLLNGAETFAWNADKSYLVDLAALVPTVPTRLVDLGGADGAGGAGGPVVLKPRTGASGKGVVVVDGPLVVQPLVESIRTVGESSLYVFAGRAVSQMDKRPAPGSAEIRVHEEYGGSTDVVPLDPERVALAEEAVRVAGAPPYARVDVMLWEGAWVVGELELIEPGLYLVPEPVNAEPFADLLAAVLGQEVPVVAGGRLF